MSCCGQQRAALSGGHTPSDSFIAAIVRYLGDHDIQLRGPVTGRRYRFSMRDPEQKVATQDVESLLRSRLFKRC